MFTAMQIILILLWFTGYDVYSKLFGGFTAGGCVLHGVVVGTIMGNMEVGLFIGGTYEPVSYTHLDGYKRQVVYTGLLYDSL